MGVESGGVGNVQSAVSVDIGVGLGSAVQKADSLAVSIELCHICNVTGSVAVHVTGYGTGLCFTAAGTDTVFIAVTGRGSYMFVEVVTTVLTLMELIAVPGAANGNHSDLIIVTGGRDHFFYGVAAGGAGVGCNTEVCTGRGH